VDPSTGLPFRAQQVVRETAHSAATSSDFNQPAGTAAIPEKTSTGFPGTYDFLSAIYRLRALPLVDGSTYSFTVRGESIEYRAELRVRGRQSVKTNVGSFNTIATQVRVANNPAANDYRIQIFFTDDERHVSGFDHGKAFGGRSTGRAGRVAGRAGCPRCPGARHSDAHAYAYSGPDATPEIKWQPAARREPDDRDAI